MSEQAQKNSTVTAMGIIGLILGIVAVIFSFLSCIKIIGWIAIICGVIAIIASLIGLSKAGKVNAPKGLLIAALIIAIIGTIVAGFNRYRTQKLVNDGMDFIEDAMEELDMDELEEALEEGFEEALEELEEDEKEE